MVKNKKGQDLSIGTLILIVLGVVVLVLLILGFSIGWSNLWEKVNIFGGGSSLGDVVTACNLAVTSDNTFDYCQNYRQIKVNGETEYVNCKDSRIAPNLNAQLSCDSQSIQDAMSERVEQICDNDENAVVNGENCPTITNSTG